MSYTFRYRCKKCHVYQSREVYFHAQVCPRCGHGDGSTILDSRKEVGHWEELRPWWKFWDGPRWKWVPK